MPSTSTMLTDYALAIVTAVLGVLLIRRQGGGPTARMWGWAFVALALAGVLGGTWHGFEDTIDAATLALIWLLNEWCIGLFGVGVTSATILAAFTGSTRRVLLALVALAFVVFAVWAWGHDSFRYVLVYSLAVMVFVIGVHLTRLRRLTATPWIVAGIGVSAAASAAQASAIALGPLDHNDIFHLIQLAAMLLLFNGARRIPVRPLHNPADVA